MKISPLEGKSVSPFTAPLIYHIHIFPFSPMWPHLPGCLSQTLIDFTLIAKDSLFYFLLSLKVHILWINLSGYFCSSRFPYFYYYRISLCNMRTSSAFLPPKLALPWLLEEHLLHLVWDHTMGKVLKRPNPKALGRKRTTVYWIFLKKTLPCTPQKSLALCCFHVMK